MGTLLVIGELILGFIPGTVVLWGCPLTVDSEHADLKTAALCNGIMTLVSAAWLGLAFLFLYTESALAMGVFLASTGLTLVVSFWLFIAM